MRCAIGAGKIKRPKGPEGVACRGRSGAGLCQVQFLGSGTTERLRPAGWTDESGVALVMVVLISMLLFGLGLALSMNSMFETEVTSNHEREALAFYAAETGLERAINGFRVNYTTSNLPEDGTKLFDKVAVSYTGSTVSADYTVTIGRRDSPAGTPIAPFPIFYTITSVGRLVPSNSNARSSSVTLSQTVAISPRTLANYTLFYDTFQFLLAFQSTFRLAGRLAVNDPGGVNTFRDTTINGDFYSAGPINKTYPFGVPKVSGNVVENGGKISFPNLITSFTSGATLEYTFNGTTRLIFSGDGTVLVYNAAIDGGSQRMLLPANGIISVTGGSAVVEGSVRGRVTVACDRNILVNGDVRYADQSPSSTDALALVAQNDVIEPEFYYTGTTGAGLTDFEASWNDGHWQADGMIGGTWGDRLPADMHIDGTLVALNGSSPTVIDPAYRLPGQLYIYGNSIAKIASVTVYMASDTEIANGLNENYTENKKLDMLPPPGFPLSQQLLPTFFTFHEVRTALR